jgi:cytochrome bd ubiquinol oxidase subunit II
MILFWVSVLAVSSFLYVLLDGFDLGVGMLFWSARSEPQRAAMMRSVAPVWDGNETWLVVAGVVLWGAFPIVYSILMSAFYLPVLLMLAGLILRGVAFEHRQRTVRMRWLWNLSFSAGSVVAAFMQGLMVGALVEGLAVVNGRYAGSTFGWLSPFAVFAGVGLCVGYALLGACWLVRKCEGHAREAAYRLVPHLSTSLLVFLIVAFVYALLENMPVMSRWLERPQLFGFPAIGALATIGLMVGFQRRWDKALLLTAALTFAAAFATLAISFWPYMIPFSITVTQAAAPHSSLAFMFWGAGLFVFPIVLVYTAISFSVFRGKVDRTAGRY